MKGVLGYSLLFTGKLYPHIINIVSKYLTFFFFTAVWFKHIYLLYSLNKCLDSALLIDESEGRELYINVLHVLDFLIAGVVVTTFILVSLIF